MSLAARLIKAMTGRGVFCVLLLMCLLSAFADGRCEWCGVRYLEPTQTASFGRDSVSMESFDWSKGELETNRIDLLIAFDASAKAWLKGDGWTSARAFAEAAVDEMNAGLANTDLDAFFRFRLAGVSELGVNLSSSPINKLMDEIEDREELSASRQKRFSELRNHRDEVRADIVAVLVDSPYELRGCSTPFLPQHFSAGNIEEIARYAYCVCSIGALQTHYSLLHEVGHVMGAGHCDEQTLSPGPQLFPYSAAFQFNVENTAYTTVMGYPSRSIRNPIVRLPFFSSPEFEMNGVCVGTPNRNDNTRTLRETYGYVANFRVAKYRQDWTENENSNRPKESPDSVVVMLTNSDGKLFSPTEEIVLWKHVSATIPVVAKTSSNVKIGVKVTNLPNGLKYSSKTGQIYGWPTRVGNFTIKVKVSVKGRKTVVHEYKATVKDCGLWRPGSYEGLVFSENGGFVFATAKISNAGRVTVKVDYCGAKRSFAAKGFATLNTATVLTTIKGVSHALNLTVQDRCLFISGFGGALFQNVWGDRAFAAPSFKGRIEVRRQGFAFRFLNKGKVVVSMADGNTHVKKTFQLVADWNPVTGCCRWLLPVFFAPKKGFQGWAQTIEVFITTNAANQVTAVSF